MPRGGYQAPSQPAPTSGPGHLSRRTDSGPAQPIRELPDAQYGEAATFRGLQQAAPLAQTPTAPTGMSSPAGVGAVPAQDITPFHAPTALPDEPVTAGAPAGPGPGPEALGVPQSGPADYAPAHSLVQQLAASNPTNSALQYLAAAISSRY